MTHDQELDREVQSITLSEDERSVIAQLDFQAKATLQVFQMAVDFWLEPEVVHGQPKALESVQKKALVVREQIQRIQAILPVLETHPNAHLRELFTPASAFLTILQAVDGATSEIAVLMERHMSQELPEFSPARDQFTRIADQLDRNIKSAYPIMETIQQTLAYTAYRNVTNEEDRKR